MNSKKELKNAWCGVKHKREYIDIEVLDSFIIDMFVLYSYDHKEEPPFLLSKDLQETLKQPYAIKYNIIDKCLGGIK